MQNLTNLPPPEKHTTMVGNLNFPPFSCSFRLFRTRNIDDNEQDSNLRSQSFSFSQDSFNSSFSSRSSLPYSISAVIPPSTTTVLKECILTIKPNNSSHILSLTLAGNHLFSGSSNSLIHRWPITATAVQNIVSVRSTSAVKCLRTINDNILVSGHQDHKIRVWKINNNSSSNSNSNSSNNGNSNGNSKIGFTIIATLPTLKDRLTKILFAKNYVKTRRHKKLTWIHHNDAVSSLVVSSDGLFIYSGSWDRSFKVWRVSDFKCLESVYNAHDDAINAIELSADGWVYTGSADRRIKIWKYDQNVRKHVLVDTLTHHKSAVNALAYDVDSCVLISGACSGVMIACERDDGGRMVVMGALLGHKKAILCVKVVGGLVCSGSGDKTVRLWRRTGGKGYWCVGVLEGHGGPVKCLTVAEDDDVTSDSDTDSDGREYMVCSGGLDGDIKVWKVWVPLDGEKASLANLDG